MEKEGEYKKFGSLVHEVLNYEFLIGLKSEVKVNNATVDFADVKKAFFVEVKFYKSSKNRNETLSFIKSQISEIKKIFRKSKFTHVLVFNNKISENDRQYYSDNLEENGVYTQYVFDINDIVKLAQKNSLNVDAYIKEEFFIDKKGKKILSKKEKIKINLPTIAGLSSDSDSGTDYLNISKDINAFARVMSVKSFTPPLAIALLGKWGSGKSFFMRKLKENIQSLSQSNNKQKVYCEGVAHVHFNAWSYMDSNLWAGIITKIFEGLQEYISKDSLAQKHKKNIEKALRKKLSIAHDELVGLESQKSIIDKRITKLKEQKKTIKGTLDLKIKKIKSSSIKQILLKVDEEFKIEEKINSAITNNDSYIKNVDGLSEIIPKKYWQNPEKLYEKSKSGLTFLKVFFSKGNLLNNLWFLLLFFILIIVIPIALYFTEFAINIADFSLTPSSWATLSLIGASYLKVRKTFKHLQPLVSSFWKIKEEYKLEKEEALFKFVQEEKALKLEIENNKIEINSITSQIDQSIVVKRDIEYRLESALTTDALFKFIEKRSESDDYKKHLGIVSIIRKDFEILSDLFTEHNIEAEKIKETEEFKKKFDKPLERIILYVDDLDRCPEERVVEVLEAVNLLMAFPLFIVVVGVDPRWVKNALRAKHQLQFSSNGINDESEEMIEPSNYLEKIFQVPFQLKDATTKSVKHMLKTLAESQPEIQVEEEKFLFEEDGKLADHFDEPSEDKKNQEVITKETIASLKFSNIEIELLQSMSDILGTNPRALKRFINIYRVIKAHEDFNYTNKVEEGELLVVMFLIALPLGKYRKTIKSFDVFVKKGDDSITLEVYLTSYRDYGDTIPYAELGDHDLRKELHLLLSQSNPILLEQKRSLFAKHNSFIKRFTFNNL